MVSTFHFSMCYIVNQTHGLPTIRSPNIHSFYWISFVDQLGRLNYERIPILEVRFRRNSTFGRSRIFTHAEFGVYFAVIITNSYPSFLESFLYFLYRIPRFYLRYKVLAKLVSLKTRALNGIQEGHGRSYLVVLLLA